MRKGFIGPLGDDIPSIFPLIAGVMLFITSIVYVNNEVASRDSGIHLRQSGLEISYIVLQSGYMNGASFAATCSNSVKPTAKKNYVAFAVILKDCTQLDSPDPFQGTQICSNLNDPAVAPALSKLKISGAPYAAFNYPVSTDCIRDGVTRAGLGSVTVVTWYNESRQG